jgi:bacteriorhodopsin
MRPYAAIVCRLAVMAQSEQTPNSSNFKHWLFFVISALFFLALAAQLLGPVQKAARAAAAAQGEAYGANRLRAFTRLIRYVLVSWLSYPIIWLLSDKGLGVMSTDDEVCLDVLAGTHTLLALLALLE